MKRVKLFFSVAVLASMTALMGFGSAQAAMSTAGKVTYVDDSGSSYVYVYTMPLSQSSYPNATISYCYTQTATQVALATAAAAGRLTVRLTGNGTTTSGYLGACTWVDVFPNS